MGLDRAGRTPGYPNWADARIQSCGPEDDGGHKFEKVLLVGLGTAMTAAGAAKFVVATPNVRCLVHIAVLIVLPNGSTTDPSATDSNDATKGYAWGGKLWMVERTRHHRGGAAMMPTREVVPSRTSPMPIPESPNLWGHVVDTQTAGDEIYGELTVPFADPSGASAVIATPPAGVNWCVSVRYQSTVPLTDEEWREARTRAGVRVVGREGIALV